MKKQCPQFLFCLLLLLPFLSQAQQEVRGVYQVTSEKAEAKASMKSNAQTVRTFGKGDKVLVLIKVNNRWFFSKPDEATPTAQGFYMLSSDLQLVESVAAPATLIQKAAEDAVYAPAYKAQVQLNLPPAEYAKRGAGQMAAGMAISLVGAGLAIFVDKLVASPPSPPDFNGMTDPNKIAQMAEEYQRKANSWEGRYNLVRYAGLGAMTVGMGFNISGATNFRKAFMAGGAQ